MNLSKKAKDLRRLAEDIIENKSLEDIRYHLSQVEEELFEINNTNHINFQLSDCEGYQSFNFYNFTSDGVYVYSDWDDDPFVIPYDKFDMTPKEIAEWMYDEIEKNMEEAIKRAEAIRFNSLVAQLENMGYTVIKKGS